MDVKRLFSDIWRETEVGLECSADIHEIKKHLADFDTEGKLRVESTGFAHHIFNCRMNKFEGLKVAAQLIGIPIENFAAIGDSENDVEMLKNCGIGIALANAQEIAKQAADHVTNEKYGKGFKEALGYLNVI